MNVQPEYIIYAVGAIAGLSGLAYIVGRFGRFVLILLGIVAAGVFGLALIQQSTATREAAAAAKVAAAGQTASSLGLTLALGGVTVLLILALAANLWQAWKLRTSHSGGKWAGGPNARWRRVDPEPPAPIHSPAETTMWVVMGQMMALQQMLTGLLAGGRERSLWLPRPQHSRRPHYEQPVFPAPSGSQWEEWDGETGWDEEEGLWGVP